MSRRPRRQGADPDFKPEFKKYDVVVSNYNGAAWPEETQAAFDRVRERRRRVRLHSRGQQCFREWKEYNEMIGLGGWGGRTEESGPYVYLDDDGKLVRDDQRAAAGITARSTRFKSSSATPSIRSPRACRREWMHVNDELYDQLRGPGQNMHILATAFADPAKGGTGRHEPMIMTIDYGKGRVFHTPMGHGNDSQECVGFITTFIRGCEWAATGKVTEPIPADFHRRAERANGSLSRDVGRRRPSPIPPYLNTKPHDRSAPARRTSRRSRWPDRRCRRIRRRPGRRRCPRPCGGRARD